MAAKHRNQLNPFANLSRYDKQTEYLYWLYEDTEFQDLLKELEATEAARDVFVERKEYKQAEKMLEESISLKSSLIIKFRISEYELDYIRYGFDEPLILDIEIINDNAEGLLIKVPKDITRDGYIAAWEYIVSRLHPGRSGFSRRKYPANRSRAPEDSRLIYAIFKARENRFTFPQIFRMYQNGTLPAYENGPTNFYDSENALANMYRRNKPIR